MAAVASNSIGQFVCQLFDLWAFYPSAVLVCRRVARLASAIRLAHNPSVGHKARSLKCNFPILHEHEVVFNITDQTTLLRLIGTAALQSEPLGDSSYILLIFTGGYG